MINRSSIYHFNIISAYCYWGCTFTGVSQAWLELTLREHLSAKSLKSLRVWILTTGEAAVGLEANRGTSHDSCERKQKQHNLISSPGFPFRPSLQTQGSSSPTIWVGGTGNMGKGPELHSPKACAALAVMWCCLHSPQKGTPWGAVLHLSTLPYVPMQGVQTLVMSSFLKESKEADASPCPAGQQWRHKAKW